MIGAYHLFKKPIAFLLHLLNKIIFLFVQYLQVHKERDHLTVEYALSNLKKPIGVAQWQTKLVESLPKNLKGSLPTVEEIEAGLDNARPK